jgi:hypothetical protein
MAAVASDDSFSRVQEEGVLLTGRPSIFEIFFGRIYVIYSLRLGTPLASQR